MKKPLTFPPCPYCGRRYTQTREKCSACGHELRIHMNGKCGATECACWKAVGAALLAPSPQSSPSI